MKRQTFIEHSKVIIISLVIFSVTALFSFINYTFDVFVGKDAAVSASSVKKDYPVIVIDAGHGGEDGGAVGTGGVLEKDINLLLSLELRDLFELSGVDAVLTRDSDKLLYYSGQENRKKYNDLRNRVEFVNKYDNAVMVSIHQNKFPLEKYSGLQVYYSPNNENSKILAHSIQDNTRLFLQKNNNRNIKEAGRNIYILKNLDCPAVLVECGFLSNPDEEKLLNDSEYRKKLAFIIFKSIVELQSFKEGKVNEI